MVTTYRDSAHASLEMLYATNRLITDLDAENLRGDAQRVRDARNLLFDDNGHFRLMPWGTP